MAKMRRGMATSWRKCVKPVAGWMNEAWITIAEAWEFRTQTPWVVMLYPVWHRRQLVEFFGSQTIQPTDPAQGTHPAPSTKTYPAVQR